MFVFDAKQELLGYLWKGTEHGTECKELKNARKSMTSDRQQNSEATMKGDGLTPGSVQLAVA
jgi:hypothetical protein